MTLSEQSNRAVRQTREFLLRLASPFVEDGIKGIRREVRAEALRLLRHYPYVWQGDCPDGDTLVSHSNIAAVSVQSGCTEMICFDSKKRRKK